MSCSLIGTSLRASLAVLLAVSLLAVAPGPPAEASESRPASRAYYDWFSQPQCYALAVGQPREPWVTGHGAIGEALGCAATDASGPVLPAVPPGGGVLGLVPTVSVSGVVARTGTTPTGDLTSVAGVGEVALRVPALGLQIVASDVRAHATAVADTCLVEIDRYPGVIHVVEGGSTIGSLRVNGKEYAVGSRPLTIPLGVATLRLNSNPPPTTTVGFYDDHFFRQRAIFLDLPGRDADVTIGLARVGFNDC